MNQASICEDQIVDSISPLTNSEQTTPDADPSQTAWGESCVNDLSTFVHKERLCPSLRQS